MTITADQRSWLKNLGTLLGAPSDADTGGDDGRDGLVGAPVKAGASPGETPVGLGPSDIVPVIPDVINELTDRRATCTIENNTKQLLKLDSASLKDITDETGKTPGVIHGRYTDFPPSQIPANQTSKAFVARNNKVLIVSSTGVEAVVRYTLDEQGTAYVIHFSNPFGATGDKNFANARLEGPNQAQFEVPDPGTSGSFDVIYNFVLNAKGGNDPNPPNPSPSPAPGPSTDIASSCLIQVQNATEQTLTLLKAEHEHGDFMVRPKVELKAGELDDAIVSVSTPRSKDNVSQGFLEYAIGEPQVGVWRVEWDNPQGQKNTSTGTITPASTTLNSLALISQGDENVRVNFFLRGGDAPAPVPPAPVPPAPVPPTPVPPTPVPPTPVPPTPVPPTPAPPVPPPGNMPTTRQPTLRVGDKSPDGWVEYLQERLNDLIDAGLKVDGDFGKATLAAVHKFQESKGLQDDGTVGNQTWAALRDAAPEAPSTDGRKPHTFVQDGTQARWNDEKEHAIYETEFDEMLLFLVSVGTQPIDSFSVDVTVTAPGMPAATKSFPIGAPDKTTGTGSGSFYSLKMHDFRKLFPSKDPGAKITDYVIQAVLPANLSGESWTGAIVVAS